MIDPSLRAVLRSRYTIRRFFISFSLLLAVLALLLVVISTYVPTSTVRDAFTNVLGNFAANVAIFLCTYAFYVFITSPELRNAEVIPLRNVEIGDEIIDLPAGASDYWFWGRTGTYFRKSVLPRLDRVAHEERKRVRIRVVIPDPDREGNSQLYMHFKRGLGEQANEHTLAANVILTIAKLVHTSMRNPYLSIEIGMCPTVPVLRYDLSNSGALITRDAKSLPALLTNSGNPYFEMFKDAVENELAQCARITWDEQTVSLPDDELDPGFLGLISGLPKVNDQILTVMRSLKDEDGHRYS
ncbi:hypothetical protein ACVW1A_003969 [Bradyrhizobium sp. LB1.3]